MTQAKLRIGIIGGGASGLSVGHYLYQRGYRHITVLERENYMGGKCETVEYEGEAYDLGGDYVTPTYKYVLEMAKEVGAELVTVPGRHSYDFGKGEYRSTIRTVMQGVNPFKFVWGCLCYFWFQLRYRKLQTPGYQNVPHELVVPFGQWMRQNGMGALYNLFAIPLNIFGYAIDYDDISAAHVVKYINAENFVLLIGMGLGISGSWPKRFALGFQHFWELVAEPLDVHLNAHVTAVKRGQTIHVETKNGRTYEFDKLVLACPFDTALDFLDANGIEQRLFSRILYNDYYTTTCVMSKMPEGLDGYANIDEMPIPGAGRPWAMLRTWSNRNLVSCFSLPAVSLSRSQMEKNPPISQAEVTQWVKHDLTAVGGKLDHILTQTRWPYAPHVSLADMRAGYFDELEGLQGENNTYYAWALLNFETVHNCTEYGRFLVERFFPPVSPSQQGGAA